MIGTVVRSADGAPVARVMASVEAVLRLGPRSDCGRVLAWVDAFYGAHVDALRSVCDNRDGFDLRPVDADTLAPLRAAAALAVGAERDLGVADWSVLSYYDIAEPSVLPDVAAGCALGRRDRATGDAGLALFLGVADATAWDDLHRRARSLADGFPGLWRWITVGYRFYALEYNGAPLAHFNTRRVAPRMPAADVGDALGLNTSYWTTHLRTVSWATFVAPDLAARCGLAPGGPATGLEVTRLEGGGACVRVAGDPEPGTSQRYAPRGLAAADALLRPARARGDDVVFLPPWDADTTREWIDRWQTVPGGAD